MSNYFFDTSAVCKHYHAETGTNKVDRLLGITGSIFFISRLAFVEVHSVFAKKVRMGQLTLIEGESATRRFRADIARKLLRVIRLTAAHYRSAEKFVRRIGPTANLRHIGRLAIGRRPKSQCARATSYNVCLCRPGLVCNCSE